MSLVDFFFNANYRDDILNPSYLNQNKKSLEITQKDKNKFWRDYHLSQMKEIIKPINDQLIYKFIEKSSINKDNFSQYLKENYAEDWVIPVLWNEFKEKWKIN